jgi:hypothetical protein
VSSFLSPLYCISYLSCLGFFFTEITQFLTPETNFSDSTGGDHTGDSSFFFVCHNDPINTAYTAFYDLHALSPE